MKIILVNRGSGDSRTIELGRWSRTLVSLCCLGLPLGLVAVGYVLGQESEFHAIRGAALGLQGELERQSAELDLLQGSAERKLAALGTRLAELQARLTRIDALGEHLTAMADLDGGEFNFSEAPAIGGPLALALEAGESDVSLERQLDDFTARLGDRERQLAILESLLTHRNLDEQAWLSGRPVAKGWMSSRFGPRTDPFSGQIAMHHGVDFAGSEGSDVLAVAAGVVTWTGSRSGYGDMVEISHGDGLVTRYAHNKQNLVQPGDVVRKGETIALMGNSGRSTGAHVHFEVYKHGRSVDPSSYVRRTRR
jgi:murein DD-endopeptidase MepM/ murein hydrolase activator NlpD